jgi:hypothetical protein
MYSPNGTLNPENGHHGPGKIATESRKLVSDVYWWVQRRSEEERGEAGSEGSIIREDRGQSEVYPPSRSF